MTIRATVLGCILVLVFCILLFGGMALWGFGVGCFLAAAYVVLLMGLGAYLERVRPT